MQRWSSRISSTNHDQKLRIRIKNRSCLFTWKFSFKTLLANILCYGLGVHLQIVCRMDSAAWSCVPWFVFNLEALFFSRAANIRDSGLGVLHNCNTPHDGSSVDLESAATMNTVIASGVLFTTVLCLMIVSALLFFTTVLCLIIVSLLMLDLLLPWSMSQLAVL